MSDAYFNRRVEEFLPHVRAAIANDTTAMAPDTQLRSILRFFAKEIERDTRHKASEMANKLSNDIHNLQHS